MSVITCDECGQTMPLDHFLNKHTGDECLQAQFEDWQDQQSKNVKVSSGGEVAT